MMRLKKNMMPTNIKRVLIRLTYTLLDNRSLRFVKLWRLSSVLTVFSSPVISTVSAANTVLMMDI